MKRHEENLLLKELLGGEEMSEFRRASLEQGLTAVRRARRRRQVGRIGAMAAVSLVIAVMLFLHQSPDRPARQLAATDAQLSNASPRNEPDAITYIGDDELFDMFPERSIALIGAPGRQELVFLDQPVEMTNARGL